MNARSLVGNEIRVAKHSSEEFRVPRVYGVLDACLTTLFKGVDSSSYVGVCLNIL